MDTFESYWDFEDDGASVATSAADMPRVPAGTHTLKVKGVEIVQAKSEKLKDPNSNPDGLCLQVILEKSNHKWIYCDTPIHWRTKVEAICRAARVPLPTKETPIASLVATLKGKIVSVVIEMNQYNGNEYPKVVRWNPSKEPLAAVEKKAAKKSTNQKLTEAYPNDDIPF